jgi:phosphoenolpyruvate-protein kinase (PTS system EI component)
MDGRRIALAGNIDSPSEIKNLLANGAEGVGLYRTEFLYLNRNLPFPRKKTTTGFTPRWPNPLCPTR